MELDMRKIFADIFEQFKLIDTFRDKFKREFSQTLYNLIQERYRLGSSPELSEFIDLKAEEILSMTESVIYKDRTYAEYRQTEELNIMSDLVSKQSELNVKPDDFGKVKFWVNELILKHYPALYELIGFGYRLLDRNVNFYTNRLVWALEAEVDKRTGK